MLIDPILKYIKINKTAAEYPRLTNVETEIQRHLLNVNGWILYFH